jgi:hypothetical protein
MTLAITTGQKKYLVNHEKILVFQGEEELERLIDEVKVHRFWERKSSRK